MSTIVIRDLPEHVHTRLKDQAKRNRRSVTKEVITLIERGLIPSRQAPDLGPPVKLRGRSLTTREIEAWISKGRD